MGVLRREELKRRSAGRVFIKISISTASIGLGRMKAPMFRQ
jgi:hypothetical protein